MQQPAGGWTSASTGSSRSRVAAARDELTSNSDANSPRAPPPGDPDRSLNAAVRSTRHARNGDSTRGWFVGSAVFALAELAGILTPADGPMHDETAALEWVTAGVQRVLRLPLEGALAAELHLLMHDKRRAEHLADALAADVAGTDAAIPLHESTLLSWVVDQPARLASTQLLDTHPPSGLRIALLEQREHRPARVVLSDSQSAAIDAELAPRVPEVERDLLDSCAGSLYAG